MSYFFVTTLQAFLGVALLSGINWSRAHPTLRPLVVISLIALSLGSFAGYVGLKSQSLALAVTASEIVALLLFLLCQRLALPWLSYLWQGILLFGAARHWATDANLSALTTTAVLNSDLLLNVGALLFAFASLALAAVMCALLVRRLDKPRWPLLLALGVLLLLPLCGNLLLLLMKLQVLTLTKLRLSFVAQVTNYSPLFNYLGALLLLLLALYWLPSLIRYQRRATQTEEPVAKRLCQAEARIARRLGFFTLFSAAVIVAGQCYWDQVASLPPQLSAAQPVTLTADDQLHIPLQQVRDGKLHRFVWVADDGKAVRFFVINRYPDRLRLGVVFDACLLCGDQGYVMEGNQVICVACGVHIFIPSIGKAGGCNPVPIEGWSNDDRELTISKSALEAGISYFSTVVTITVTDPVDGRHLTNTRANYQYRYAGKTWFFTSEANYDRFRATPEQFVPSVQEQ